MAKADKPIKAIIMASRMDHKWDSYLRELLKKLIDAGMVRRVEGFRYWLASKGEPPAEES